MTRELFVRELLLEAVLPYKRMRLEFEFRVSGLKVWPLFN